MKHFDIPGTASTPAVHYDADNSVLSISGESYPENSFDFYARITTWLKENLPGMASLRLRVDVSYLNSSSTKCMLDLLDEMEEAFRKGFSVAIDWLYDPENPRSLDLAEEFAEEVTLPFSVVAKQE